MAAELRTVAAAELCTMCGHLRSVKIVFTHWDVSSHIPFRSVPASTRSAMKVKKRGKGFPYSIPSVGPGADPGVQAVSLQVTVSHPPMQFAAVGCHYFPPGLQLPPQPQSITALWLVPSYTAWWQRHIGVSNLPKVVTQRCLEQDLNPRPTDRKSNALPLHHRVTSLWRWCK